MKEINIKDELFIGRYEVIERALYKGEILKEVQLKRSMAQSGDIIQDINNGDKFYVSSVEDLPIQGIYGQYLSPVEFEKDPFQKLVNSCKPEELMGVLHWQFNALEEFMELILPNIPSDFLINPTKYAECLGLNNKNEESN